jgi:fatty-acyl-CoA synthase/long-chain acyl-CoA synthetase
VELSITTLVTVPPLLNMLADGLERSGRLCSALRLITVGGARANAKILARAMDLLPHVNFALTYGLTEAGPRVSTNFVKRGEADTTCVGTPLRNVEVRLANRENCAAEVCIRGSSLMRSYADAEWEEGLDYTLKTSDWGEMIDGKLHIRGRLDRAINRGGRLLVAEAIEDVLREHPAVKNVRVEGRQHSFWGEVPVAIVSIHKDKPQPTANDLRHFCAQRLSTSEMPVGFEIVDFCKGNVKEQKMLAMERLESFTSGRND